MERLGEIDISWAAMVLAITTLIVALFARRLLPAGHTNRGRLPIIFLLLSLLLRALAVPIEMGEHDTVVLGLKLASAILLAAGMTGVVGKLVFDIVLARLLVVPTILRDLLLFVAFIITVMTILQQSGASLVSLVTTSGVLIAVVGLALQQPIANTFAGLSLQLDRTIGVGDWIQIENQIGRIVKVSFRATTIWTRDGDLISFPNNYFMTRAVTNYSRPQTNHRMLCSVGFHYRHPPNEVKRVIAGAVRGCPGVLAEPEPEIVVRSFADSAVEYAVVYWIDELARDIHIESDVRTRVWYAARRAGIEIPFPQRTVQLHEITEETTKRDAARDLDDRRRALAGVELFRDLEPGDLDLLAEGMHERMYAGGERIVRQGDAGDSLFLMDEGEVGIVLEVDGVERQVAKLAAGDVLGELSLMTGERRTATCVALSDVCAYEISHELFDRLLREKPALAEMFSTILSERQHVLDAERGDLSAEASGSHRRVESKRQFLKRIQTYFRLGRPGDST